MKGMAVVVTILMATAARADDGLSVHGWVDGYYAWNGNHPRSHLNFFPGVGTTAERADRLALNIAALELVLAPKPSGFHLTAVTGDSADVVHTGEPHPHRHPLREIYQASVSLHVPVGRGLLLEGGVYPSHIGFEAFFSKDNWSYTRGWLGELSPYYQAGVKAAYAWSDRWSGQLHLLQGWQLTGDNNSAKSVGTQIAYTSGRLSAALNTLVGPELPNDNSHTRVFGDLIATWKATSKLSLGGSLDRGHQSLPDSAAANWLGGGAYARYAFDDRRALAFRAERFRDSNNGISGTAQTLSDVTLTYEVRPSAHLILKLEGRKDHSTAPVFNGARNQTLVVAGAVVVF